MPKRKTRAAPGAELLKVYLDASLKAKLQELADKWTASEHRRVTLSQVAVKLIIERLAQSERRGA